MRDCPTPILEPMECIKQALEKFGDDICVSCSFGSCSIAVLHMALKIKPNIKVLFNNTGVQFKETYEYRDFLVRDWSLNLIETKPEKSFWECVEKYGLPQFRNSKTRKPKCCIYLKENPAKKACKKYGIKAQITGLRVAESRMRMMGIGHFGQYYFAKSQNVWRFHPIAFWTTKELWEYLEQNNIPISAVYTKLGQDRNGCMPCTGYMGWREKLANLNPRLFKYINKLYSHERGYYVLDDFNLEAQALEGCDQVSPRTKKRILDDWF